MIITNAENIFDFQRHARYVGRIDWHNVAGPVLSWAGSSIMTRFVGTSISMVMKIQERTDSWFDVIIDGQVKDKLLITPDCDRYLLASGLTHGPEHTVEVYKRVEAMFGTVQFLGFILDDGGYFLEAPAHGSRRIEFIGDSISVGSGNEGKDGDPNIAEHENNALAYGTLTAKRFHAEHHTIAVSGIGLCVNYGDERVNTMPDQYGRLDPLHDETQWDFTLWIPDVVVINLGTNDSNYEIAKDDFISTYVGFVKRIRTNYNVAHIILALGPFAQVPLKDYIFEAYEQLYNEGDSFVHYLLFDKADSVHDGLGETGHPTTITHAKMAEQLSSYLEQVLSW